MSSFGNLVVEPGCVMSVKVSLCLLNRVGMKSNVVLLFGWVYAATTSILSKLCCASISIARTSSLWLLIDWRVLYLIPFLIMIAMPPPFQ